MRHIFNLQARALRLWLASLESQSHAYATIAMRMPGLLRESASGVPKSPETRRMVAEKVAAASQGAINAASATRKLAAKAMAGHLTGVAMAAGFVDIADAALRPARTTVRSNAKRLAGRRSTL